MTYIKICGITNRLDALAAIELGADALGFIAFPDSARFISALAFRRIREVLPPDFPAIVVAKKPHEAVKYEPSILQYYEEDGLEEGIPESTARLKVVRVRSAEDIKKAASQIDERLAAIVMDAFHVTHYGGSGTRFDWSLAQSIGQKSPKPLILAGGLTPKNVAQALETVRPYAVDVSSGVEDETPGNKCRDRMAEFIGAVREWDARNPPEHTAGFLR
jgi:phosphoribosylanthranilate isomerase